MNGRVLLRWLLFTGLIISFTTDIFMFIWVWQSEVSLLDGTTNVKDRPFFNALSWQTSHVCFTDLPHLKCSFKHWKQNFEAGSESGQEWKLCVCPPDQKPLRVSSLGGKWLDRTRVLLRTWSPGVRQGAFSKRIYKYLCVFATGEPALINTFPAPPTLPCTPWALGELKKVQEGTQTLNLKPFPVPRLCNLRHVYK